MKKRKMPHSIKKAIRKDKLDFAKKIEEILDKKPYSQMVKLLYFYENKTQRGGLRARHFRYVLVGGIDGRIDNIFECEQIFGHNIVKSGIFKKGCIENRKDLNYYLTYLENKDIIRKATKKRPHRYKLTQEYYIYLLTRQIQLNINRFDDEIISYNQLLNKIQISEKSLYNNYSFHTTLYLMGMNNKSLEKLKNIEKKQLIDHLINIKKSIEKIENMRVKDQKDSIALYIQTQRNPLIN